MLISQYYGCTLTLLSTQKGGYYDGCVNVRVNFGDAEFLVNCMAKETYELEVYVASLGLEKEKMLKLCELIDNYGSNEWTRGVDEERSNAP